MIAFVGVGLPASGKTTILKAIAEYMDAEYVCPDDIRQELTGDMSNQDRNEEVFDAAYVRIAMAYVNNRHVVIDATNAFFNNRTDMVSRCREAGYSMVAAVWVNTPMEVCITRNRQRDRVVPDEVMMRMVMALWTDPPRTSDGFSLILTTRSQ